MLNILFIFSLIPVGGVRSFLHMVWLDFSRQAASLVFTPTGKAEQRRREMERERETESV